MIAARILPAGTSVWDAARAARDDGARLFLAPRGQVVIAQEQRPGWQRLHAAGYAPKRWHGGALQSYLAFLFVFAAGFWCGWMAAFLDRMPK